MGSRTVKKTRVITINVSVVLTWDDGGVQKRQGLERGTHLGFRY